MSKSPTTNNNEHYLVVLADLRKMKADAELGIIALESLMAQGGSLPTDDSTPNRLIQIFEAHPDRHFDVESLAGILGDVNPKTIRGALHRMVSGEKPTIVHGRRGKYRLSGTVSDFTGTEDDDLPSDFVKAIPGVLGEAKS